MEAPSLATSKGAALQPGADGLRGHRGPQYPGVGLDPASSRLPQALKERMLSN